MKLVDGPEANEQRRGCHDSKRVWSTDIALSSPSSICKFDTP